MKTRANRRRRHQLPIAKNRHRSATSERHSSTAAATAQHAATQRGTSKLHLPAHGHGVQATQRAVSGLHPRVCVIALHPTRRATRALLPLARACSSIPLPATRSRANAVLSRVCASGSIALHLLARASGAIALRPTRRATRALLSLARACGLIAVRATQRGLGALLLMLIVSACARGVIGPSGALTREPVFVAALDVTSGTLEQLDAFQARVAVPVLRAQVAPPSAAGVELRFVYEGATTQAAKLASGELRRQLGLKLLSFDSCNVTYVMWRLGPRSQIHVSQKVNAGQTRHEECGDRGYRDLASSWHSDALPAVLPGQEHRLTARLRGDQLRVSVDGVVVWRGAIPLPASNVAAPKVGIRSDNAKFRFSLSGVADGVDNE